MRIKYTFTTQETAEVEINEKIGAVIKDLDRIDYNNNKKESRRHCSLEKVKELYGYEPPDPNADIESEYLRKDNLIKLKKAIAFLTPDQKDLVRRVFFNGEKITDIAKEFGITKQSAHDRLQRVLERLKKHLQ
jgi:RNA polymerase sigma-70 factor (ECF subfamily)